MVRPNPNLNVPTIKMFNKMDQLIRDVHFRITSETNLHDITVQSSITYSIT